MKEFILNDQLTHDLIKGKSGIISRINFHFQDLHRLGLLFFILPGDHEVLPWSKINPAKGGSSDSYLAQREGYIYRTHLDMLLTSYPKFKEIYFLNDLFISGTFLNRKNNVCVCKVRPLPGIIFYSIYCVCSL